MKHKELTHKQKLYLQMMGVDVVHLPEIYDEVSLFDYVNRLLTAMATALGTSPPTYELVKEATEKVIKDLDLLKAKND